MIYILPRNYQLYCYRVVFCVSIVTVGFLVRYCKLSLFSSLCFTEVDKILYKIR